MSGDMEKDLFAEQSYGKLALKKIGSVPENFRLYAAGWLGKKPEDWKVMKVKGAEFCVAKSGPNKGRMTIMVKGSQRTAQVTREEILAFPERVAQPA